jgi:hypothetical protein
MENQATRILLKRKLGRLYLGDASWKRIIQVGLVLIAKPKSLKENSEPFLEIS